MSTSTQFIVSNMKCQGCVDAATSAVKQVHGAESVSIDLEAGTAQVVGDIDPQAVCQALSEAGYPAVVKSR